jgi:hypothetical protein
MMWPAWAQLPRPAALLWLQAVCTAAPNTERARGMVRLLMCWQLSAAGVAACALCAAPAVQVVASQQVGQLHVAAAMS